MTRKSRKPYKLPTAICKSIKVTFEDFEVSGQPFYEMWSKIIQDLKQKDEVNLVNLPEKREDLNSNDD
jgi:hypothetical protein